MTTPGPGSHESLATYDAVHLLIERAVQARSIWPKVPVIRAFELILDDEHCVVGEVTPDQVQTEVADRVLRCGELEVRPEVSACSRLARDGIPPRERA